MRHLLEARPEPLPQPLDIVAIVAVDLSAVSPTRSGKTGETGSQQTTSTRVHSDGERSHKQEAIDPGHYAFTTIADNAVELSASMVLKSYRDTTTPELTVKRRIEIVQPPLQHPTVRSVGVRLAHEITFAPETTDGIVDAWQILQGRQARAW